MLFEKTPSDKNGKKATITHSRNKTMTATGYTGTLGFTEQIKEILENNDNSDAINATVFNTTSTISDIIPAQIQNGVFNINTDLKNTLPLLEDNTNATKEMETQLRNSVFNFDIKPPKSNGGAPIYAGGALPLPIKTPKPKKMKGGNAEFQGLVDTLEERINEIVSHPILVKIKSLKANSVHELCKRTVIYKDMNRDSFYLTKDIMDIVMDFLFVDYTTLDVFKQIYYYYQKKMDEDTNSTVNDVANNIIRQQIYTHSGIMKIINVLLNKFTYEQYYPDFVKTPATNPKQSLLEKDTEYHREVHGKYNEIEIGMNFGEDHVKYTPPTPSNLEDEGGDIEFKEGGQEEGGQRGGEGEEATALAIALAIQSTTPPPAAVAEEEKTITDTDEQNKEKDELKEILPQHRKYIYISRFMKLIEAFREINPTTEPETKPQDVNSLHVQKMLEMMIYNHLRSYNMVKQVLGLMINDYNTEFFEVLNYLVRLQNSKLISYLKINNYENPMRLGTELANYDHSNIQTDTRFIIDYNRRYNVFVNNPNITENWRNTYFTVPPPPPTENSDGRKLKTDEVRTGLKTMALQYNDDDFPYYEKKNDKFYASEAVMAVGAAESKPRGFTVEETTDGDEVVAVVAVGKDDKNDALATNSSNKAGSDNEYDNDFENDSEQGGADQNAQPKYKGGAFYKTLSKVNQYDKTYLFGRMNQIFLPHYSNEEVAQNMESIIDLITNPVGQKKLFTIGYGASGAGKTSSLIYLNKGALENREGIIIHLCNRLAAMGYKTAEIQTKEFFSSPQNSQFEEAMSKFSENKENKQRIKYTQKPYADNANKNNPSSKAEDLVLYTVERGPFYFQHTMNNLTQKEEFLCYKDAGDKTPIGNNGFNAPSEKDEKKSPVNETELSIALSAALTAGEYKGGDSELQFGGVDNIKDTEKTSNLFGNVHTYRTFEEYEIDGKDGKKENVVRFPHPQFDEKEQKQNPDMLVNLGKLLIYLIDTDRLVKATTNNPNSSRSHVLLFLKLTLGTDVENLAPTVDIVIGDFAGVENAFECDAVSVSNFLAIQKDVVPRTLYYKYDAKDGGNDVIHGGDGKDDEEKKVKEENNAFAKEIYGKLKGLKDGKYLYKIETVDDSTTTEFEVNDNMLKEGDIMDYLLTYEGQSLMKVLENKDYTNLQKSLEWVGRHHGKFGNRIDNYKSEDNSSKGDNYLKITEHEDNLKSLSNSVSHKLILEEQKITELIRLYNLFITPTAFEEQLNIIKINEKILSESAKTQISEIQDKSYENTQAKINNIKEKAQNILNATINKTFLGFIYDGYTEYLAPTVVFEKFNKQLNEKRENFTVELSKLSNIQEITELNEEVKKKITEEASLIKEINTYYSEEITSSKVETVEYDLNYFLPVDNTLIKVVNGNGNVNSYIINESVQFDDIVFNTLVNTINNIKQIEGVIQAIEVKKQEILEELKEKGTELDNNIKDYQEYIDDAKHVFNDLMEYNLTLNILTNNNEIFNNYNYNFVDSDIKKLIRPKTFYSIVTIIEETENLKLNAYREILSKFNENPRNKLIKEYTNKLNTLKAIYDGNIAEQERMETEKKIIDINKKIETLNKSNEEINKFITSKEKEVNNTNDSKGAQSILEAIVKKNKEIYENITTKQEIKDEIKIIQPQQGNTDITKIEEYSNLETNLDKVKALYTTKLNELDQKSADETFKSIITPQLELLTGKQQIFKDLINELEKISETENNNDEVNKINNQLSEAKKTIDENNININEEVEIINGVISSIKSETNQTFITNTNNIVNEITTLYNELNTLYTQKYEKYQEKIKIYNQNKTKEITKLIKSISDNFEEINANGININYNTEIDNYCKSFNIKIEKKTLEQKAVYYFYFLDFIINLLSILITNISNAKFEKTDIMHNTIITQNFTANIKDSSKEYSKREYLKSIENNKIENNNYTKDTYDKYKVILKNSFTTLKNNFETYKKKLNQIILKYKIDFDTKIANDVSNIFSKNGGNPLQKGGAADFLERYNKNIDAIKLIKAQVDKLYKYYQYGKKVCENRKKEGVFINQSLEEVRKTIQEILVYNADGSIETTPDFIENCLKLYCPSGKDCFQMNQSAAKDAKIPSELFDAIFQHYKPTATTATDTATPEELKKKFYNELIVNIFCVFNITKSANNPPVVPYIDINALKRLFFNRNSIKVTDKRTQNDAKLFTEIQKVLLNIAKYPKKLKELHDSKDIQLLANQFLANTGITIPYPPQANATDNTKTPFSSELTETQYKELVAAAAVAAKDTKITDVLKNNIRGMIELVDRTNAASVIGTLEFVDIMSKFGTTNNICSVDDINFEPEYIDVPPQEKNPLNNDGESKFTQMKKVLQLHEISNYDFLNHPDAKQPVDFFQLLSDHYKYEQGTNTWDNPSKEENIAIKKGGKRNKTAKHRIHGRKNQTEKNI
jgi:hypothetical protein